MKILKTKKLKKKKISYKPSAYLKKMIAQSEKEFAEGKIKSFKTVEEFIKALNSP